MNKENNRLRRLICILMFVIFLVWTLPSVALARGGRGMSGGGSLGSRGSRSMTPARPYNPPPSPRVQPMAPSRPGVSSTTPPRSSPSGYAGSTDSFWRGLGGGFLGGLAGGMLGRWLFGGSTAQAAPGSGGFGSFGLMDLIILGAIGFIIYKIFTRRRREPDSTMQGSHQNSMAETTFQPSDHEQQPPATPEIEWDLEKGIRHIEQLDPLFTEEKFKDQVMDYFFKIQGAWVDRDMSTVKHLLTKEMFDLLQQDAERLRSAGHINRLENMAVRQVNLTEAWQESGQDYITVRIYVTLLDYTIDEATGQVVEGSKVEPVKFEEYWTFTRPGGNNPWQLSGISQA